MTAAPHLRVAALLLALPFAAVCGEAPPLAESRPAGTAPMATPEPLPLELFLREEAFRTPVLSPDGRHIALVVPRQDQSGLVVMTSEKSVTGLLQLPYGNHIVDVDWISDRQMLVSLGAQFYPDEPAVATGELAVVDVDGKNFKVVYGSAGIRNTKGSRALRNQFNYAGGYLIDPLFDDPDHVAIQTRKWADYENRPDLVMRLNIKTSELTEMARSPELGAATRFLLDHHGRVRYAVTARTQFKPRT